MKNETMKGYGIEARRMWCRENSETLKNVINELNFQVMYFSRTYNKAIRLQHLGVTVITHLKKKKKSFG